MSDLSNGVNPPELPSVISQSERSWLPQLIWIIPVIAILVGLSLAYKAVVDRGAVITIAFKAGDGLEAGKTVIQFKGVNIGLVKTIALSQDNQQVLATVQLNKDAEDFSKEDTRFWAVRPRITTSGVSGLSTLLSGPYIAAELGTSQKTSKQFVALDVPPILTAGMPGREFVLKAPTLGSHDIGTQIYFRRLPVGQVVAYELDKNGKDISMKVFVNAPYDQYVTTNTRFWNASGIDVTVGATGIQLQTESMVSVIVGGIAFEAPPSQGERGVDADVLGDHVAHQFELAKEGAVFPLFQNRTLAMKQSDSVSQAYFINFKQSVKGLTVGAPVEFRGVNVGEVTSIGLAVDPKTFEIVQPVQFNLYPERLQGRSTLNGKIIPFPKTESEQLKRLKAFIDKGLRAQLRTANLLTGQQYIGIDMYPDAPKYKFNITKPPFEMRAVPSVFDNFEQSVASTLKSTDTLVKKLDAEVIPELSQALKNINAITASESPLQTDMRDSLREISKAASSMKSLADMLDQQPQSLIFGKPSEGSKK